MVYNDHAYYADLANFRVYVPKIKGKKEYLVALHELGHIMGNHMGNQELAAWRWVLKNTIVPLDQGDLDFIAKCLKTYNMTLDNLK